MPVQKQTDVYVKKKKTNVPRVSAPAPDMEPILAKIFKSWADVAECFLYFLFYFSFPLIDVRNDKPDNFSAFGPSFWRFSVVFQTFRFMVFYLRTMTVPWLVMHGTFMFHGFLSMVQDMDHDMTSHKSVLASRASYLFSNG